MFQYKKTARRGKDETRRAISSKEAVRFALGTMRERVMLCILSLRLLDSLNSTIKRQYGQDQNQAAALMPVRVPPLFFYSGKKRHFALLTLCPYKGIIKSRKKGKEAEKMNMITLEEAAKILKQRNEAMEVTWLRKKAAAGAIAGAEKIGSIKRGTWLIPREWAETYVKDTRGRKRKS